MAERVKAVWRIADCVCFDVDSTVVVDEGIDKLADFMGKGKEVAEMLVAIWYIILIQFDPENSI